MNLVWFDYVEGYTRANPLHCLVSAAASAPRRLKLLKLLVLRLRFHYGSNLIFIEDSIISVKATPDLWLQFELHRFGANIEAAVPFRLKLRLRCIRAYIFTAPTQALAQVLSILYY